MGNRQRLLIGRASLGDRLGSIAHRFQSPLGCASSKKWAPEIFRVALVRVPLFGTRLVGLSCEGSSRGDLGELNAIAFEASGAKAVEKCEGIDQALGRVEAALFVAQEPLSPRKLAILADLADGTQACTYVEELRRRLRHRGSALQPVEVAGGFLLMTRPQLADWLAKLHGHPEAWCLSAAAMETLAVTAYRQPVMRGEIEAIRGVQSGELLRMLMEKGFLRIVGRAEELGRPLLYGTTRKFLEVFGLRRLEELPSIDQISGTPPIEANSGERRSQFMIAS